MNLRQLEVFQAVLQTGNMSAAARLLCITPSAVSKAVAHTELQLGYRLFNRSPAGLTPTPEAQVLATESTGIYRQLDALKRTARNLATSDSGDVRLGATPEEFREMLGVAVYMGGGPSLMYAANALAAYDEFAQAAN